MHSRFVHTCSFPLTDALHYKVNTDFSFIAITIITFERAFVVIRFSDYSTQSYIELSPNSNRLYSKITTMDPSYDCYKCHDSSCRSMMTMETNDTTNNTSISSGVSLDMDVHGLTRGTSHDLSQRSNHPHNTRIMGDFEKEYHVRCGESNGDSIDTFGESFMMDSFANGESFASSSCCNYEPNRFQHQRTMPSRLTEDLSSILIIEEENEDTYAHDELGKYAAEEPTNSTRMNFSTEPNTFTELSCQVTHG